MLEFTKSLPGERELCPTGPVTVTHNKHFHPCCPYFLADFGDSPYGWSAQNAVDYLWVPKAVLLSRTCIQLHGHVCCETVWHLKVKNAMVKCVYGVTVRHLQHCWTSRAWPKMSSTALTALALEVVHDDAVWSGKCSDSDVRD